jgi:hypothetical protein
VSVHPGTQACTFAGTGNGPVTTYRRTIRDNKPIALINNNESAWSVVSSTAGYVQVSHQTSKNPLLQSVSIPINRLNKFKQKADPDMIKKKVIGQRSACVVNCTKNCHENFGVAEILQCRLSSFATQTTEQQVSEHLVSRLRIDNQGICNDSKKAIVYKVNNKPTCSVFWASAYGVSEDKMKGIRSMLRNGSVLKVHGSTGTKRTGGAGSKYGVCYAFWHNFFDENCQRPNDELRLFPVNNSQRFIYDTYFMSWFEKQLPTPDSDNDEMESDYSFKIPSFSLFKSARWDKDFRDVTVRAKHYHCLCHTCHTLKTRLIKGFANNDHYALWKTLFDAHEAEKHGWRKLEAAREAQVKASPSEAILLSYDDTSSLQLPKLSNRDVKNVTKSRLNVTPFNICNYASGESAYVYTVKNRYKKGGNALCTVLYHMLRKIKFGDHECRNARTLYLHADNASMNKNNVLFQFLTELIQKQWFDTVYVEFGPPGHTHNGRDAVHHIHNRIAGNFFSFTLGEFQGTWVHSWRKDGTMPTAVAADVQYDWAARYEACESKTISGFTNTVNDKNAVYAFKLERGRSNLIEVMWKRTASDAHWLGADHQVGTPGFVLLRSFPQSNAPAVIPPNEYITAPSYINQCTGERMRELAETHLGTKESADAAMKWLRKTMQTGSMPHTVIPDQPVVTKASWGPRIKIGIPGFQGDFYSMREDGKEDSDSFWDLPSDLKQRAESIREDLLRARDRVSQNPNIRYSDVHPDDAREMQQAAHAAAEAAPTTLVSVANISPNEANHNEEKEIENFRRKWGAKVDGCIVGHFAVCDQKCGRDAKPCIEIIRITEVDLTVRGNETFKGVVYGPATADTSHAKCLQGIWNKKVAATQPKKRKSPSVQDSNSVEESPDGTNVTMKCWSVLLYFRAFTAGRKLPKAVVDELWKIADDNELMLFEESEHDSGNDFS